MTLLVCSECKRHVRAGEIECPFCADKAREPLRPAPKFFGKITRAAILFGASAIGACDGDELAPVRAPDPPAPLDAGVQVRPAAREPGGAHEVPGEIAIEPPEIAAREREHAESRKRARVTTGSMQVDPDYGGHVPLYGSPSD